MGRAALSAVRLARGIVFIFSLAAPVVPVPARAHPLHTTYAELSFGPKPGMVRAMIRLFADDFTATVLKNYPSAAQSPRQFERAAYTYAAHRFRLADARGAPYPLGWCGLRRVANFIWVCLGSDHFAPSGPIQLGDQLMHEVFEDQINLVRVSARGRSEHMLYTGADGLKRLGLLDPST